MSVKINTENQLGTISHEDWMQRALRLASQAFSDDEVPIGFLRAVFNASSCSGSDGMS